MYFGCWRMGKGYTQSFILGCGRWGISKGGNSGSKRCAAQKFCGDAQFIPISLTFYFMCVLLIIFIFFCDTYYCISFDNSRIHIEFIPVKDSGTCGFCIKREPVLIKCSKAFSCPKAHCVWALSKPCVSTSFCHCTGSPAFWIMKAMLYGTD